MRILQFPLLVISAFYLVNFQSPSHAYSLIPTTRQLSNSDRLTLDEINLSLSQQRYNFNYKYADEKETFFSWESHFKYLEISDKANSEQYRLLQPEFGFVKRWHSDLEFKISMGWAELNNSVENQNYKTLTYSASLSFRPIESIYLHLLFDRNLFGTNLEGTVPLKNHTCYYKEQLNWSWRIFERLMLKGQQYLRHLSDGNLLSKSDTSLLFGLATSNPWVWVGMGTEYLDNKQPDKIGYWSPSYFRSYGVRSEFALSLNSFISTYGGLNYSKIQEKGFLTGESSYISLGMQLGSRDKTHFKMTYIDQKTQQGSGKWKETTTSFNFVILL